MKTKKIKAVKDLALFEIIFLILGIVAFSYSLSSSFGIVSADDHACTQIYNSGGWEDPVPVPVAVHISGYCESLLSTNPGTDCRIVECPSDQGEINDRRRGFSLVTIPRRLTELRELRNVVLPSPTPAPSLPVPPGTTPPVEEVGGSGLSFRGILFTEDIGWRQIGANAAITAALYAYADSGLEKLGLSPHWSRALGLAISNAYAVHGVVAPLASKLGLGKIAGILASPWFIIGVFVFSFLFSFFKDTEYKVVSFSCNPWTPPKGGDNCDKCDNGKFGCSEYQCRSLGASCEFIRQEGGNACTWVNRNDHQPPVIEPWEEILSLGYEYTPDGAVSPPNRGVNIVSQTLDGCVEAFFPLEFGVTLDEPAKCKISPSREDSYESMTQFFQSGSTYRQNHSMKLSLQSQNSDATLINGGVMDFFVRCEDRNGNSNTPTFSFNFCVEEGPDLTPPEILGTSILDGSPIGFGETSVELDLFVNEPAECKWSTLDKAYDEMENQMICSSGSVVQNLQQSYTCSTTLTGLRDGVDNEFYFRCRDQPHFAGTINDSQRNTNTESFPLILVGTRPLEILGLSPDNETIKDSTDIIDVLLQAETDGGYRDGDSTCSYKGFGTSNKFVEFIDTGSFRHSQTLSLPEGDYVYEVRCIDTGGNTDEGVLQFSTETDNEAPNVVRVYRDGHSLKVITNEEAECRYTNFGCSYSFEDGSIMGGSFDGKEHFTSWDPDRNFFIKCRDEFFNEPDPNTCSIEVRPSE